MDGIKPVTGRYEGGEWRNGVSVDLGSLAVRAGLVLQSLLMLVQTNLALMSFWVALMPGWDKEWSESNVSLLMTAGTKGRRGPVELSGSACVCQWHLLQLRTWAC